jgi:hypothetical protein
MDLTLALFNLNAQKHGIHIGSSNPIEDSKLLEHIEKRNIEKAGHSNSLTVIDK